jgi:hypothetical protein
VRTASEAITIAFEEGRAAVPSEVRVMNFLESDAEAEVQHAIQDLLRSGQVIPDDIAAPVLEARHLDQLAIARAKAINTARERLSDTNEQALRTNADEGFGTITSELVRLFDRVSMLAEDLKGVRGADAAIAAGPASTAAWSELNALANEYADIRRLQVRYSRPLLEDASHVPLLYRVGQFRNSLDVHPFWLELRVEAWKISSREQHEHFAEWLMAANDLKTVVPAAGGWQPGPGTDVSQLLWLARHTLPWAPHPRILQTLYSLASIATQPLGIRHGATQNINALAEYAELTQTATVYGHVATEEPQRSRRNLDAARRAIRERIR